MVIQMLHLLYRPARAAALARAVVAAILLGIFVAPAPLHAQTSGITSPAPGSVISGDVPIFGTAVIEPFQKYELHFKQDPSGDDAFIYFAGNTSPVMNGQLGVWQAGGLPPGIYTLRLRVVKADGNYAEFYVPNLSVNQGPAPTPTSDQPTETPTPTPTYTPAPQPTPALGQVTQPQLEEEAQPTPTPPAPEPGQADTGSGGVLPTATPPSGDAGQTQQQVGDGDSLTRELGEALSVERLRTQFFNGVRIAAALFIGLAALLFGKRLFVWVMRRYG